MQKEYDQAVKFYNMAVNYEENNDTKKSMYLFLGISYNNLKKYEDAINAYQQGISLAKGDDKGNFYYRIANIYYSSLVYTFIIIIIIMDNRKAMINVLRCIDHVQITNLMIVL